MSQHTKSSQFDRYFKLLRKSTTQSGGSVALDESGQNTIMDQPYGGFPPIVKCSDLNAVKRIRGYSGQKGAVSMRDIMNASSRTVR